MMIAAAPEFAALQAQFEALKTQASALVAGLAESQFNWRPARHKWSIAECLLHLNMLGDRYVHVIEPLLEEARTKRQTSATSPRHGWFARWILSKTEPPPKRSFRAARSFRPPDEQPVTAVLPTFLHLQDQLIRQIDQAASLGAAHIKVPALAVRPLKFDLHLTFAWIAAHERRHLWQARQVRQHGAFPDLRVATR